MTALIDRFDVKTTATGQGYNLPQKMGRRLWLPMFLMAIMAFPVAWILGVVAASEIAANGITEDALRLRHLVPAFGFIGFLGVFASISFAIARILGAFRKGGGDVQEAIGDEVQTLEMPVTARVFMASMMMGMMTIGLGVVLHFVAAANAGTWAAESVVRWAEVLEAVRRIGVAMYLFGIVFGLGTIIHVLRFQAIRIRELADRAA